MQEVHLGPALESEDVIAPFARKEVSLKPKSRGLVWFVFGGVLILIFLGVAITAAILSSRYLNDPYRALEPFSVSKYLVSYRGLAGSKFRATVRVENDLGWKDGTGRLMLFSTSDDARPFVVLVPQAVCQGVYFTKGQVYRTELEVKEGGLIYANSCQKD